MQISNMIKPAFRVSVNESADDLMIVPDHQHGESQAVHAAMAAVMHSGAEARI